VKAIENVEVGGVNAGDVSDKSGDYYWRALEHTLDENGEYTDASHAWARANGETL
jgi:hypothetical protein